MNASRGWKVVGLPIVCALVVGCRTQPHEAVSGVISGMDRGELGPGDMMPDMKFVDSKDRPHLLSAVREDASIIVVYPGPCCRPNAAVVAASQGLMAGVSVVAISSMPTGCRQHSYCVQTSGDATRHIVSVCDARGEMRRLLGVGTTATVFVVDRHGRIVARAGIDALPQMRKTAESLARDAVEEREALYGGG